MSVRKLRSSWWVDFTYRQTRYRRRTPAQTREQAVEYETLVRGRLSAGMPVDETPARPPKTLSDFAPEWFGTYVMGNNKPSEQRSKRIVFRRHLLPFFGDMPLAAIGAKEIEKYKSAKLAEALTPATVNRHLAALRKCLNCAVEWGELSAAPRFRTLRAVSQRLDYLSPEEGARLLGASSGARDRAMILVGLRTGMRLGELFGLDWRDVDFQRRVIAVERSVVWGIVGSPKSGKSRYIPFSGDVAAALAPLRKERGFVFGGTKGQPLAYKAAYIILRGACKRAGLRRIGWHTLRHTFASQLAAAGVPLPAVQSLLGHASITMTMRYAHLAPSSLERAVHILDELEQAASRQPTVNTMPSSDLHVPRLLRPIVAAHFDARHVITAQQGDN